MSGKYRIRDENPDQQETGKEKKKQQRHRPPAEDEETRQRLGKHVRNLPFARGREHISGVAWRCFCCRWTQTTESSPLGSDSVFAISSYTFFSAFARTREAHARGCCRVRSGLPSRQIFRAAYTSVIERTESNTNKRRCSVSHLGCSEIALPLAAKRLESSGAQL